MKIIGIYLNVLIGLQKDRAKSENELHRLLPWLPMKFFETFPECSLPSTVSKITIKLIGHHSRLRDVMDRSYLIYACTRANHVRYSSVHVTFCGSSKHSL